MANQICTINLVTWCPVENGQAWRRAAPQRGSGKEVTDSSDTERGYGRGIMGLPSSFLALRLTNFKKDTGEGSGDLKSSFEYVSIGVSDYPVENTWK